MTDPRFEEVRQRAATAIVEDGVRSAYVGLVRENGHHEYHFGNQTAEASELRELAAVQLGMLLSVLSERSDSDAAELAECTRPRGATGTALNRRFGSDIPCLSSVDVSGDIEASVSARPSRMGAPSVAGRLHPISERDTV